MHELMELFNVEEMLEPIHRDQGMEGLSVFIVEKLVTFKLVVHNAIHASEDQYPGTHCHRQGTLNEMYPGTHYHRQGTLNEIVIRRASSHVREPQALVAKID